MSGDFIRREAALAIFADAHPLDFNAEAYRRKLNQIPSENVVKADGLTPEAREFVQMCPEIVNFTVKKLTGAWDKAVVYGTDQPAAQAVPSPTEEAARNGEVYL